VEVLVQIQTLPILVVLMVHRSQKERELRLRLIHQVQVTALHIREKAIMDLRQVRERLSILGQGGGVITSIKMGIRHM